MCCLYVLQNAIIVTGIHATMGVLALTEEYADMSAHAPVITKDIDAKVGIIMF